jgi:hypothetical protein
MAERLLINGEPLGWFFPGRVLAGLATALALVCAMFENWRAAALLLLALGITLLLIVEISAAVIRRRRAWLEILPDGFKVWDRHGERAYQDFEVVAMAYGLRPIHSGGVLIGYARICRLWPRQGAVIEVRDRLPAGAHDPLADWLERLDSLLKEGFSQALEQGVEISGDGWTLSNREFCDCRLDRENRIKLSDIVAAGRFKDQIGLWIRGDEEPSVCLPQTGRNACFLPILLEPYLAKETARQEVSPEGLGRVLLKRQQSRIVAAGACLFGCIMAVVGLMAVFEGAEDKLMAALVAVGGLGLLVLSAHLLMLDFRCHEWGVSCRNLFGRRQLLYRDVEAFTYQATIMYYEGIYAGTTVNLRFDPSAGHGSAISYSGNLKGQDADLEQLRDEVSRVIAIQMHQRLSEGEIVPWTDNLAFHDDGLAYRPRRVLGRSQPKLLKYEDCRAFQVKDGVFYLFETGNDEAVIYVNTNSRNFFPGFCLLAMLHAPSEYDTPPNVEQS